MYIHSYNLRQDTFYFYVFHGRGGYICFNLNVRKDHFHQNKFNAAHFKKERGLVRWQNYREEFWGGEQGSQNRDFDMNRKGL